MRTIAINIHLENTIYYGNNINEEECDFYGILVLIDGILFNQL